MTDSTRQSLHRLESMGNAGMIDASRALIDANPAILQELGLTADRASELMNTQIDKLESVGGKPPLLEAIIRAVGRPPLIVRGGKVEGKTSLSTDFAADIDLKISKVEAAVASVGRIEFINHDYSWGGTGWVIDKTDTHLLIVTNRHVAKLVARRSFLGDGVFLFAPGAARYGARIDFLEEVDADPDPTRLFDIEKFTYIAEDAAADVAIARIALPADGAPFSPAPIDRADTDAQHGETVAVIGYPAKDSLRNDPTQMANYFRNLYDVKRFSPGFLIEDGGMTILRHDCTTLGGNSGSPVISLDSGKAVGLHYAGTFGVGNSAVRISTINALLDGATPNSVPGFDIAQTERRDGSHDAAHFEGREGYDPDFLQVAAVPLPTVPQGFGLSAPSDATACRPHELRYQNFGVLYSGTFKTPILAALNIDGEQTRPQKRGSDKWYADLRIPAEVQLGKEDYDHVDIDRGHLIRRAATNWGADDAQAKRSNDDSFHYPVAAPQHRAFNRSNAQWLGLENYIMSSVRTHGFRACVFTGPILSGDEPMLKDTGAVVPLKFFKLVTMLAEDDGSDGILRLHATAYVLSQVEVIQQLLSDQGRVEAVGGFEFGAYKTFQVRIKDLESMSRLDFGPLRDVDPLARRVSESEAVGASPRPVVEVESFANIVL
ncbi:DNA/RNA non-specific endonuclease [Primorskyibacter flagellatus]|uniref:Endonuclease G n=1 Tax=Primorskyibacter flagellatus TaxID=1387277 RepID=A0A1W2BX70_9RHOB|nr:DNA/RNA non-specific endonuclease [Primorskyibacter flagellatus]SMC77530.1 endonuclease G [Primorskyibacter flagellatus]